MNVRRALLVVALLGLCACGGQESGSTAPQEAVLSTPSTSSASQHKNDSRIILVGEVNLGSEGRTARYRIESRGYEGKVLGYVIDWGDGEEDTLPAQAACPGTDVLDRRVVQHQYETDGIYSVQVTARYGDCGAVAATGTETTEAFIGAQPGVGASG